MKADTKKPHDGCIRTVTGRRVNVVDPRPDTLDAFDMAHALAMQCRFVGHTREFYSVAQHCVLLSCIVPPTFALWGLLHDAAEAWLGDVSRPLKRNAAGLLEGYRVAETRMMNAVCVRFNLPPGEPACVTQADEIMLVTEQRDLFPEWYTPNPYASDKAAPLERKIIPWDPATARAAFIVRLRELGVSVTEPAWAPRAAAHFPGHPLTAPGDAYIG